MAQCEKCGTGGHDMREMGLGQDDQGRQIFVGPCCVKVDRSKMDQTEIHYGLEISSHMGIKAYVSYGGLTVEFKKTAEDIRQWLQESERKKERSDKEQETQDQMTVTNHGLN